MISEKMLLQLIFVIEWDHNALSAIIPTGSPENHVKSEEPLWFCTEPDGSSEIHIKI